MPIKKRRPVKHLNKNDERLMRRDAQERQALSVGSLQSRFPSVDRLELQMEFVSPQGHVLGSEYRSFQSNDTLNFIADCPGRCGNGRMDVEAVVNQMVGSRQTTRESKGMCRETLFAGSPEMCNCELRCKITAQYFPPAEN